MRVHMYYQKLFMNFKRALNFIRPSPCYIPLKIEELYGNKNINNSIEKFIDIYYSTEVAPSINWKGVPILKNIECKINTIDINNKINYDFKKFGIIPIQGMSTEKKVHQEVQNIIQTNNELDKRVLVFLDSEHSYQNVTKELEIYPRFVTLNSYCIVEDTMVNGHPSFPSYRAGP